jgi:pSer/pThr/pTyr-binding forkhead associated (FHA) protein
MNQEELPDSTSIRFISGPMEGQSFFIYKPTTTIGRDDTNDIVVRNERKVSRFHARLLERDGTWSIERLSQSTFLTVNQQRVQQAPIANNAIIGLGDDSSFVFLTSTPASMQAPPEYEVIQSRPPGEAVPPVDSGTLLPSPRQAFSAAPPPHPPARPDATQIAALTDAGLPSIEITSSSQSEKKTYALARPVINIGRDPSNDVIINDRIVSGFHLRIGRQGNAFVLIHPHPERPKTLNGLLHQGRKIRGDEQFSKTLTKGDIFRIGDENGTLVTLTYNDGTGTSITPAIQPIN